MLVAGLPRDSRYLTALRDDEDDWSDGTYLLAAAVDHLGVLASDRRWKEPPSFVRRPGSPHKAVVPKRTAEERRADVDARLARARARANRERKVTDGS